MNGPLTTAQHDHDLTRLLAMADPRREARAEKRPCENVAWDGVKWAAKVDGSWGQTYHPRIQLVGARTFSCNCQDHKKLRGAKGPCKHVISLAQAALDEIELIEFVEDHNRIHAAL